MEFLNDNAGALGAFAALVTVIHVIYSVLTAGASKALDQVAALKSDVEERADKLADERAKTADAIVERFQSLENRVTKLQSDFEHMPDREQVHRIELGLERLNGRMETLDERLKPVAAVAMRLQEFELEKANGK